MKKYYCDRCNNYINSWDINKIKVTKDCSENVKLEVHKYIFCNRCLDSFYKFLNME